MTLKEYIAKHCGERTDGRCGSIRAMLSNREDVRPVRSSRSGGKPCVKCKDKGIIKSIADGAAGLVKHLGQRAGVALDVAAVEVAHNRLGICMGCEHRKGNNCDKCGCIIVAKVAQDKQTCPEGKW